MVDARAAVAMVYRKRVRRLEERIAELEDILRDLADTDECSLDREGCCHTHNWFAESRCPHDRARALLAAAPAPPSSKVDPFESQPAALPERTDHA